MSERWTEKAAGLSTEQYIDALLGASDALSPVPTMPDSQTQINFVGLAGKSALEEAARFVSLSKAYAQLVGKPLNANTRLMDFGSRLGTHHPHVHAVRRKCQHHCLRCRWPDDHAMQRELFGL